MNRYSIATYAEAIRRIEADGYLFDTSAIAPSVRTQLWLAMRSGRMVCVRDTYPARGYPQDGAATVLPVWQMVRQEVEA